MITKFKIYDSNEYDIQHSLNSLNEGTADVGDLIIVYLDDGQNDWLKNYKKIKEFFSTNIGLIVSSNFEYLEPKYKVKYLIAMKNKNMVNMIEIQ